MSNKYTKLQWLSKTEVLSLHEFSSYFNYNDMDQAYTDYETLVQTSRLSLRKKTKLLQDLSSWKAAPSDSSNVLPIASSSSTSLKRQKTMYRTEEPWRSLTLTLTQGKGLVAIAERRAALTGFENHECLSHLPQYLKLLEDRNIEYLHKRLLADRGIIRGRYLDSDDGLPPEAVVEDKVLNILSYLVINGTAGTVIYIQQNCVHIRLQDDRIVQITKQRQGYVALSRVR
ncbi:hypothetical protein B0O80DRAFT_178273 [Mortierella sp. GBAus27b]|nr:hypothetical protein B0O80DRAFT_178273 [Mortierella sp. GBAus27b]